MVFKVTGYLDFMPTDVSKKHAKQSVWKRTAMIRTDCDIDRYYASFIEKRFNMELNKNLRGSHVTIISDRLDKDIFDEASKVFNGKKIDFFVDIEPRTNGSHFWLRVYCQDAESIRESIGLSRDPYFSFHLTLGHVKDRDHDKEQGEYILRQCKMFNILSSEPKPKFEDQIIKTF